MEVPTTSHILTSLFPTTHNTTLLADLEYSSSSSSSSSFTASLKALLTRSVSLCGSQSVHLFVERLRDSFVDPPMFCGLSLGSYWEEKRVPPHHPLLVKKDVLFRSALCPI